MDSKVRKVTYRTGDSAKARTLTLVGTPAGGEVIKGRPHFVVVRELDGMRCFILARRVLAVDEVTA